MKISETAVYLTDNGRTLCGAHLGSSAKRTGRDVSGQEIQRITPTMVAGAKAYYGGWVPACESCGREACS